MMKTYKIVEIERKCIKNDYSYAEIVMESEAQDGWEVVTVTFDQGKDIRGSMIIVFSRER
ncbi:MAG: DUF4177 domain-containing protein [Oscillospiraceae bacterium]|nr:DUF4177 domain-containing protein [Oscillospiraceae bacterium]